MEVFGLSCANLDSADCVESAAHPEREQAFLCNLRVRNSAPREGACLLAHLHHSHFTCARGFGNLRANMGLRCMHTLLLQVHMHD